MTFLVDKIDVWRFPKIFNAKTDRQKPTKPRYKQFLPIYRCLFFNLIFMTFNCSLKYVVCNVYKMSGRSVSVCTDTSASHEYLCTLIQNGHSLWILLIKRPQTVTFSNYIWEMLKTLYQRIQILIKHVFLFCYPHELLMSLIMCITRLL